MGAHGGRAKADRLDQLWRLDPRVLGLSEATPPPPGAKGEVKPRNPLESERRWEKSPKAKPTKATKGQKANSASLLESEPSQIESQTKPKHTQRKSTEQTEPGTLEAGARDERLLDGTKASGTC